MYIYYYLKKSRLHYFLQVALNSCWTEHNGNENGIIINQSIGSFYNNFWIICVATQEASQSNLLNQDLDVPLYLLKWSKNEIITKWTGYRNTDERLT